VLCGAKSCRSSQHQWLRREGFNPPLRCSLQCKTSVHLSRPLLILCDRGETSTAHGLCLSRARASILRLGIESAGGPGVFLFQDLTVFQKPVAPITLKFTSHLSLGTRVVSRTAPKFPKQGDGGNGLPRPRPLMGNWKWRRRWIRDMPNRGPSIVGSLPPSPCPSLFAAPHTEMQFCRMSRSSES
jgi:hypothetical protein